MAASFSAGGNGRSCGVPVLREAARKLVAAFRRDRLASSALEFALTLPLLLAITGGLVDFGLLWRARGEVALATNAGAERAQMAGAGIAGLPFFSCTLPPAPPPKNTHARGRRPALTMPAARLPGRAAADRRTL